MFINHNKKFVYLAIPKTGSYSIHNYFDYNTGHPEPDEHHMGIREFKREYPHCSDYYAFAFVRNPWSKLLSTYKDFTLRRKHQYSGKVRFDRPLLSEFENFEDFCLRLHESHWRNNVFFRPQVEFVEDENGVPINYIGDFKYLGSDFQFVCRSLGIGDGVIERLNRGQYQDHYRSFYTVRGRNAIAQLYKEDIERFGYDF